MALVERYVDTDVATSGDGSQATPWKHLSEAFPTGALPTGLLNTDSYTVHFTGSAADSQIATINTLYNAMAITIIGECQGKKDTTIARLTGANPVTGALHVTGRPNLTLLGVQILPTGTSNDCYGIYADNNTTPRGTITLDRGSYVDVSGLTGISCRGVTVAGEMNLNVRTALIKAHATANCVSLGSNGTYRIYNTTIVNGQNGIVRGAGTAIVKNTRFANCVADGNGTFSAASTNNASTNATTIGANPQVSQTFSFVDAANSDYHITSSDPCKNLGVDLSADANLPVTVDVDGDALSATPPIGFDAPAAPITATKVVISSGPPASVEVEQGIVISVQAQDDAGNVQNDLSGGILVVRARSAPTGWDLSTALASGSWAGGAEDFLISLPMSGDWVLGVDDDNNILADSADSSVVSASLPSSGGGVIIGDTTMYTEAVVGGTSQSLVIGPIKNADGTDAALAYNSPGLSITYQRDLEAEVAVTPANIVDPVLTPYTASGFAAYGTGPDHRIDLPDAAYASGASKTRLRIKATGIVTFVADIALLPTESGARAAIVADLLDDETLFGVGKKLGKFFKLAAAVLLGKTGASANTYRNIDDTADVVTGTVDPNSKARTTVALDWDNA